MVAKALYPRASQFVQDALDMPENQNVYLIDHRFNLRNDG